MKPKKTKKNILKFEKSPTTIPNIDWAVPNNLSETKASAGFPYDDDVGDVEEWIEQRKNERSINAPAAEAEQSHGLDVRDLGDAFKSPAIVKGKLKPRAHNKVAVEASNYYSKNYLTSTEILNIAEDEG